MWIISPNSSVLLLLPSDAMPTVPFPPQSFCGYYLGSWLWVISLLFFGPFTDFYYLVLCFIIKHPFLFNLRSVDHVVFYEAWWMWRLPKLVGIWERGTVLIMQWRHKRGRWGPGRIIIKVLYGEVLHRSSNTYSLLYTISAKKAPLLYTFYRQTGTPFTYLV